MLKIADFLFFLFFFKDFFFHAVIPPSTSHSCFFFFHSYVFLCALIVFQNFKDEMIVAVLMLHPDPAVTFLLILSFILSVPF